MLTAERGVTKVLIVSYHFPPSDAVGARRPARLARLLPRHGFEVEVLGGRSENAPGLGRIGAEWVDRDPVAGGRPVLRVPTPYIFGRDPTQLPRAGLSMERAWWKARAYTEWLLLTADWQWRWGERALRALEETRDLRRYDLVLASMPPAFAVIPVLRRFREIGIPVVMDWRDLWTTDPSGSWLLSPFQPYRRRCRRQDRLLREAKSMGDQLVFTTPVAKAEAEHLYGVDGQRITVVPNAFEGFAEAPVAPTEARSHLQIVYAGSLSYGRDRLVVSLISAMAAVRRQGGPDVELVLVGGATDQIRRQVAAEGMEACVRIHGWMERDEAIRIQLQADALLLLQPTQALTTRVAIPAKLFEYMTCRRNILSMANTVTNDVVRTHDLGVTVQDEDPAKVAQALATLADRVAARPFLPPPPEEYSEEHTVARYAEILRETLHRSPRRE